ncbi:protein translocase subunit SecF [Nocardioides marmotae]|uniref:protein translocase subunit SecF n=1 Tax=Nocardioides marmotae TaxID=2663857 RepID=UPI0012B5AE49|nr:protein translocase subunit SecF [Nocardioides marmotae]MBC9733581.1 protein translocase subunit SecF [Nocardioides marmotae]MTB84686.1 protein translocase subunit SecF [Nocardioides marmotae]
MGKFSRLGNELYTGRRSIDFVGRRPLWYAVSLVLVGLAIGVVVIKGLNFGIEFTGGTQYRVAVGASAATQDNADALRAAVADAGVDGAESPVVTTAGDSLLIQTEDLSQEESDRIVEAITETVEVDDPLQDISQDEIGASWGQQVAERALIGVAVFLGLVMIFIWLYFREWKMSVAALVALFHDIAITVGIYALSGFPVTPSAVTGLLAILGFSLYDTVVVFDKVRENTHEYRRPGQSYADATNLAVNQTLVRSINTGIVALIPIGAILWVSAVQLGASSLQDLALSQFVGMAAGVYSSVVLAPRILVQLKSTETEVKLQERHAKAKARALADPYASVPAVTSDSPVAQRAWDPESDPELVADGDDDDDEPGLDRPVGGASPVRAEASGRGRVVPQTKGEVRPSGAAGRQQPSRVTRSKRGKK